ncbi:MAG: phage tail protein [Acidaminococcaceae bacterium]|nr:phage tail protein [Acidaminococcaceae bacterium]
METIFLNAAGTVLFVRDDMEQGNWTQEEYSVNATFPYASGKVITRGMRIAFRDPATNTLEMFEIRNVTNIEPEHYQQIIAEHIVISELSDDHINNQEITDKTAAQALTTVLTGTLWSVGNDTSSGNESSADISRGSVWQAVNTIGQNWNVYITPRVTLSAAGSITGRYLDIAPAEGVWRGVRLSIDKNMSDSSVVYDDSNVITAMYGYGGNVEVPQASGDDQQQELTFADVVWTATSAHPAKPADQTYLEWPEKTTLYGRNGRPRYGYYQNGNIKDAEVLLEKTWEALKQTADPQISISGTVTDLYRLGYADQPLRLHDTVIVDIPETGEHFEKEIIRLDVDLVDPTATRPEIGDYIPNIIYINRDTEDKASGGGGGGGGRGMTKLEDVVSKYETWFDKNDRLIGMFAGIKDGDEYLKVGQICLAINDSDDILANIKADHINISSTQTAHMLAGCIEYDANGNLLLKESSGGGVLVEHNEQGTTATFGVWDRGNLTGGVMVQQINGQSSVKISGDVIDINGSNITISADRIDINGLVSKLQTEQLVAVSMHTTGGSNLFEGANSFPDTVTMQDLTYVNNAVEWKSQTVVTSVSVSTEHTYLYGDANLTPTGRSVGRVVLSTPSTSTIYYLGHS